MLPVPAVPTRRAVFYGHHSSIVPKVGVPKSKVGAAGIADRGTLISCSAWGVKDLAGEHETSRAGLFAGAWHPGASPPPFGSGISTVRRLDDFTLNRYRHGFNQVREAAANSGALENGSRSVSVDEFLELAGGWGRFQTRLQIKLCILYGFIGLDLLLSAFMAPLLQAQWGLSLQQVQLISSVWFVAGTVGLLLSGVVADARGRRDAIVIFKGLQCAADVLTFVAPSVTWLLVARGLAAIGGMGTLNICYPLVAEYGLPAQRASSKQWLGMSWNIIVLWLVAVAALFRNASYKYLFFAVLPGIIAAVLLLLGLPESPRFLLAKGSTDKAEAALRHVASVNGASVPDNVRLAPVQQEQDDGKDARVSIPFADLFAGGQYRKTISLLGMSAVGGACYYGLCFAPSGSLGSNLYTGQLMATMLEVPSLALMAPLADRLGRRTTLMVLFGVTAVTQLVLATISAEVAMLRLVALLAGRCAGNMITTLKWVVGAEIIPTPIRGVGLALVGVAGQLGSSLGPLVFAWSPRPFVVLGALCVPAFLLVCLLEETADVELD